MAKRIKAPVLGGAGQAEDLGVLGLAKVKILKIQPYTFEGRAYNKVTLANGTTEVLNDADLASQRA